MNVSRDDLREILSVFAAAVRALLQDKDLAYVILPSARLSLDLGISCMGNMPSWSIDLEWNRREDVIKRLRYDLSDDELIGKDAIVPTSSYIGSAGENLLVVEVKKSTNKDFDGDIWKLQGNDGTGRGLRVSGWASSGDRREGGDRAALRRLCRRCVGRRVDRVDAR